MGLLDRDWFVEDHKSREEEYVGDFSLHSKKISGNNAAGKVVREETPIEQELRRIRKERADKNKAAIAFGVLSLVFAAACYIGWMSAGMWLPILAGIVNAYMCAGAENRMKKEGDKTDLNKWAKNVTMLSVLAMLGLVMRSM